MSSPAREGGSTDQRIVGSNPISLHQIENLSNGNQDRAWDVHRKPVGSIGGNPLQTFGAVA